MDLVVPWDAVETGQASYDFSGLDGEFPNYAGTTINLIFQPISYGNINNPPGGVNVMTPSYVFTSAWASRWEGNEADAFCTMELQALLPAGTDFNTTWENWVSTKDSYEKSVLPNPPIQLLASLNHLDTDSTFVTVPDFETATAVANGFGFANNGLQKSDITDSASGAPCRGDCCAMFDKYAGQVPLELQPT